MPYETILVNARAEAGVREIVLNRPDKRNALSRRMVDELTGALTALAADVDVRVVLLRGAGPAFCAGADLESLKALSDAAPERNLADSRALRDLFLALYRFPRPTIAVVEGPALAGGAGLVACCDFALASSEAVFGYTEVKVGFVAAMVMVFLTRQIGERRARDLLLTGRRVSAREALSIGLVNRVLPPTRVDAAARELALALSRNAPEALALTKGALPDVWTGDLETNLERAAELNARARATKDCKEGIAAFLEKRKPSW